MEPAEPMPPVEPRAPTALARARERGARRRRPWADLSIGRKGLVVVGLPLVVTLLAVSPLVATELERNASDARVRRSLEIRSTLHELGATLAEVESATRGHLLTGSTRSLDEYEARRAQAEGLLAEVTALLRDEPEQAAGLDELRATIDARFALYDRYLAMRAPPPAPPPTIPLELAEQGLALRVELNDELAHLLAVEAALLDQHTEQQRADGRRQLLLTGTALVVGLGAALVANVLFTSGVARRVERLTARATPGGDLASPRRGDELAQLEAAFDRAGALIAERDRELRGEAARLEGVIEAQHVITQGSLDPVALLDNVVEPTGRLTGAEAAVAMVVEDDGSVCWASASGAASPHLGEQGPADESLVAWCLASGQVLVSADTRTDPRVPRAAAERAGAGSLLAAPVTVDGRTAGALAVYWACADGFDPRAERTVRGFSALLGGALGRARAFTARAQALVALEHEVEVRRAAEQRAAEARDAAEQANQAKSEFLSRMSHELRTPLNAVLGFGQLLELEDLSADQKAYVGHLVKAGYHLLDLINEVLDISRIESGRLALSMEPVRVADVVDEALDLVRPLAAARGIELPAGHDPQCRHHVRADRQRLKQVLLNLLANAVKYNHVGGRVTVACGPAEGGRFRISITDTGPGISAHQLERLYVPFDRLGAELTDVEGTGLGLALSKRLVDVMGGTLGVTTALGRGSTFWVDLDEVDVAHEEELAPPVPAPASSRPPSGERVVLYIEDNLPNLRLVERLLARRQGVRLLTAMQGTLGSELAHQHGPDLILLDLNLPDRPGVEVLASLRSDPRTSGIPVVVVSADATPGQVDRLLAAGATAYLTKPFDVSRFLDLVDELLADRNAERATS